MAGRGRGKSTGTLTQDQLQSMGVTRNEMQAVSAAAPPPLYPILQSKPVPLESNPDRDYKILWKEDFISYLRESAYYTTVKSTKGPVERYSDKVINVIENDPKRKQEGDFIWAMMPAELKPTFKRNKSGAKGGAKRPKVVDINAKLSALEQKESFADDVDVKKEKPSDSDEEKDEELEEEVVDEEMDDENDYGNNYFDNGEAYNEEDDNLDDGPVY